MILQPGEICPYSNCKYANDNSELGKCQGRNPSRMNTFQCDFVDSSGSVSEDVFRSNLDMTGKMQPLSE
jgi:hypothetical protein